MIKKVLFFSLLFLSSLLFADESFVISDIRVEGLQRISAASVFANLPFNINDKVSPELVREAIRVLFRSGNYTHVEIGRDADVLIISLQERPSISKIEIEGNKAINTEDLLTGLKKSGLADGEVFKRPTLEAIRLELQRQYVAQGRYDAQIVAEVEALPRNRVALNIDVDEGTVAKIKHLNIVGNKKFSTETLLQLFEMHTTGWFSWASGNDKYARERMQGDLERLESFYRDQGYLKFAIDSTQVSLSPEKNAVFVTVNVSEGEIYHISDIKLSGDIIFPEAVLRKLILLNPKDVYSQQKVSSSEEVLAAILGGDGYTYAKINSYPNINEETKMVELTFFVDPGKRTYVNRVEFFGNTSTKDEVLRREMRQMEAAPASGQNIEQSRVRLERLGFFKAVESEIVKVPGSDDLIDVVYTVEEQHSGSIGASIGFSDSSGVVLTANLQQNNFLGSGKKVGFSVTKNDYQLIYNVNYTNPYYTIDGVSRGFSLFYRETDFDKIGLAEYSTNSSGANLNYGYPISEISRIGFGFGYANIEIATGAFAPQEIIASPLKYDTKQFISSANLKFGKVDDLLNMNIDPFSKVEDGFIDIHGDHYDNFTVNASVQQSKLNRGLLPDKGFSQVLSAEAGVPSSDLEYYKINYDGQFFISLAEDISIRIHTQLGYGDGYGDTGELPFFENFLSGGFGSVRGYERLSLGPKGTPSRAYALFSNAYIYDSVARKFVVQDLGLTGGPFGGNILVESGAELIFPFWFVEDRRSLRTVLFLDTGNVFDASCGEEQQGCYEPDANQLRHSYGFGLTWISPMGPLTFSLARPFNETAEDKPKFFQFSIGTGF